MLNWRKNQVATPGFVKLENAPSPSNVDALLNRCSASKSEQEETSNAAYFYRHYRAEAREKLFYEELFESRMKHQQILEEKEKRRKKKQKGGRKSNGRNRKKAGQSANANAKTSGSENGVEGHHSNGGDRGHQGKEESVESIDLALPKPPKGPWSYKLGPEYDLRPEVPGNVVNEPVFNYAIPTTEQLKRRHLIKDEEERRKMAKWWKMPSHLIRRTDYGNLGNVKISMRNAVAGGARSPSPRRKSGEKGEGPKRRNGVKEKRNGMASSSSTAASSEKSGGDRDSKAEELRKQELIKLYLTMKQKQKLQCGKKERRKKRKDGKRHSVPSGPVDVRTMLHKK